MNIGTRVTTLSIVQAILRDLELGIEFDGRLLEMDQLHLTNAIYEAMEHIRIALHPLLNQKDFHLSVIGAEIDDQSESLWVWIDDPENPL